MNWIARSYKKVNKVSALCAILFIHINPAQAALEDWRIFTALSSSDNTYPAKTQDKLDFVVDTPNFSKRWAGNFELAIYWPISDLSFIHGPIIKRNGDGLIQMVKQPLIEMSVVEYILGYSIIYFPSGSAVKGFYSKFDIGPGQRKVSYDDSIKPESDNYTEYGLHLLLGAGYGVRLSREWQGLIGFYLATTTSSEQRSKSLGFSLGVLW